MKPRSGDCEIDDVGRRVIVDLGDRPPQRAGVRVVVRVADGVGESSSPGLQPLELEPIPAADAIGLLERLVTKAVLMAPPRVNKSKDALMNSRLGENQPPRQATLRFLHAESKAGFASALSEPARFRECCTSNMDVYLTGVICVKTPPGRFSESSFSVEKIERESFLTLLRVPYLAIRDQRASHASPAFSSPNSQCSYKPKAPLRRDRCTVVQFPITTVRAPCRDGIDRLVYHFSDSVVFPLRSLASVPAGDSASGIASSARGDAASCSGLR